MRPWGEAVATWTAAVERWSPAALDRALDALLATDIALKDTRVSTDATVDRLARPLDVRERGAGRAVR